MAKFPTAHWRRSPASPADSQGQPQATQGLPGRRPQARPTSLGAPGRWRGPATSGWRARSPTPRRFWSEQLPATGHSTSGLLSARWPGAGHKDGAARLHPPHPHRGCRQRGSHPSPSLPCIPSALSPLGPPCGDFLSLGAAADPTGCVPPARPAGGLPAHSRPAPRPPLNRFRGPPAPSRPAPHPHPAEHVLPGGGWARSRPAPHPHRKHS